MSKRPANHVSAQKAGKERDLYTCQVCGSKENPEGHHIIDYQYGGAPNKDNIITLCSHCHDKAHNGKFTIQKF